jgi:NADH-quinone oxidoreductase subunit G
LDLGLVPAIGALDARAMTAKGALDVLVLLGADEIALSDTDAFVIYIGSHGDRGASRADVILPGAAYTEKSGVYVNTEGRVQLGARAVFPKGEAREDWAILRALAGRMDIALGYDSLEALRARLMRDHPSFGQVDYVAGPEGGAPFDPTVFGSPGPLSDTPLKSPVEDFYMTNPIARASVVMAQCSALHARPAAAALAAE